MILADLKKNALRRNGDRAACAELKSDYEKMTCFQLFQPLSQTRLRGILPKVIFREFRTNHAILLEQHKNEFVYIDIREKVKIFQISEDVKDRILSLQSAGEFFGEMSLIDGARAAATVSALEPSTVATFPAMISTSCSMRNPRFWIISSTSYVAVCGNHG